MNAFLTIIADTQTAALTLVLGRGRFFTSLATIAYRAARYWQLRLFASVGQAGQEIRVA